MASWFPLGEWARTLTMRDSKHANIVRDIHAWASSWQSLVMSLVQHCAGINEWFCQATNRLLSNSVLFYVHRDRTDIRDGEPIITGDRTYNCVFHTAISGRCESCHGAVQFVQDQRQWVKIYVCEVAGWLSAQSQWASRCVKQQGGFLLGQSIYIYVCKKEVWLLDQSQFAQAR